MARVLIVGGGCRGRRLATAITAQGHAVRITTRSEAGRAAIESCGAECFIGDPDRLATLRGSLEHVTVACWLLAVARGTPEQLQALHGPRLERFLGQVIDTTVRGFIYEAGGTAVPPHLLTHGAATARAIAQRNAIPATILEIDPARPEGWLARAHAAVRSLLAAESIR